MDSAGLRWHRLGNITVTLDSTAVVGTGTEWMTAGIKPGDALQVGPTPLMEIASVADDTHLTLAEPFTGPTAEGQSYAILRCWSGTLEAEMAAKQHRLLELYETVINEELLKIQGLSAYQVAVKNGYTGTEAEWLEALKGGAKGDKGDTGKDAYEVYVMVETEKETPAEDILSREEWLASLRGKDLYSLAKDAGFTGTLKDFLLWVAREGSPTPAPRPDTGWWPFAPAPEAETDGD